MMCRWLFALWRQAFDEPGVTDAAVAQAIMQAAATPLPELDCSWYDAVSAPKVRQWHLAIADRSFELEGGIFEEFPTGNDLTLRGDRGPNLAATGTRMEIALRRLAIDPLHRAMDTNL